ncbi:MAG: TRAP transporter small permease [Pseudolabrys sp.]|nr:TRAP transporter small permease [Pseudolabrys sp.]MDP2298520.1 TRAP transporter small permease [Pseudolabrys sp.]
MKAAYVRGMEALYIFCAVISGLCLVIITVIIPYGVFTRYVLNSASSWPEPLAVLLVILFTFMAAAACYRGNVHIAVTMVVDALPTPWSRASIYLRDGLMALLSVFAIVWGIRLVEVTWNNTIAEFPFLSVGITYMPIPVGGFITLLFIIEQVWIGPPGEDSFIHREPVSAD